MVWAFDRVHGGLVRIGPGQADSLKARGHAGELVCPVSDCPSPEFRTRKGYTTAAGTYVADGFRHRTAPTPGHEPESLAHITGKLVVARWLGRTGWTEVRLERQDTQSGRTPDVTAIRGRRRLAVEVQFARLSVDEWLARTSALEASGFEVLWLWGAHGTANISERLSAAQAEMLRRGRNVVWLCPDEERFSVAAVTRRARPHKRSPETDLLVLPDPGDVTVLPQWAHASSVRAEPGGLAHPALDALVRRTEWLRRARLGQLYRCIDDRRWKVSITEAARARQRIRPQASTPSPPARYPFTVRVEPTHIPKAKVGDGGRFDLTADDQQALEDAGLTSLVATEHSCDGHVYQPVGTWHPAVTVRLLRRHPGTKVKVSDIGAAVERHTLCEEGQGVAALAGLLRLLERAGWIRRSGGTVTVLRSLLPDEAQQRLFDP